MFASQKPGIEEEDLLRFLKKTEETVIIPQFEGAIDTGKIKKSALKNWDGCFQLREYYKEASCQRRRSHGFLDCYLEMLPEFGNDPDPSGKHIQRPQSPA